jgi:hypothetical protein
MQAIVAFFGDASKMLVNAGSLKLVNIWSTKMMKQCRTLRYGRGKKRNAR